MTFNSRSSQPFSCVVDAHLREEYDRGESTPSRELLASLGLREHNALLPQFPPLTEIWEVEHNGVQRDVKRFDDAPLPDGSVEEPVREPGAPRSQTRRLETRQECPDQ